MVRAALSIHSQENCATVCALDATICAPGNGVLRFPGWRPVRDGQHLHSSLVVRIAPRALDTVEGSNDGVGKTAEGPVDIGALDGEAARHHLAPLRGEMKR